MSNSNEQQFGKVVWEKIDDRSEGIRFFRPINGNNDLRILTDVFVAQVHKYKCPDGKTRTCVCSIPNGRCGLCEEKNPALQRFFVGILDLSDERQKVWEFTQAVRIEIRELIRRHGSVTAYDVRLKMTEDALPKDRYRAVKAATNRMQDDAVALLHSNALFVELKRWSTPSQPEDVDHWLARFSS